MQTFEFSIIASGLDPTAEDFEARFYDAGCDDATISFQKGHIIVDFAREAETATAAISSAIAAVRAAGATVDRVEPDPLVSLSDIAARSGLTRAAISYYANGQRGTEFPAPMARVTSDSPLWDWATVARWLFRNNKLDRDTLIAAEALRHANVAVGSGEPDIAAALERHVRQYEQSLSV